MRFWPHTLANHASNGIYQPYAWIRYLSKLVTPEILKGNARFLITAPPQHGKSNFFSTWLPSWYLAQKPEDKVILATYAQSYSDRYGTFIRDNLRNPVLGIDLREDSQTKRRVMTKAGGQLITAGVGGPVTGEGADLFIVDDPFKTWEEAMSPRIREKILDWFRAVATTRMQPGGSVVVMHCLTGDTNVLMADGNHVQLKNLKVGDQIATYENGKISTSKVVNWKNQGPDKTFSIRMISGKVVRGNERHPFLTLRNGKHEWIKIRDLIIGDQIVSLSKNEHGKANHVQSQGVPQNQDQKDFAHLTTAKQNGLQDTDHLRRMPNHTGQVTSSTDTELQKTNITKFLQDKMETAQFANNLQQLESTCHQVGNKNFAFTTATKPKKSEDFCATNAICLSNIAPQNKCFSTPLSTYEITLDAIIDIQHDKFEDVFDIQVEKTENFIANGLVSHNTRWHESDLIGELAKEKRWTYVNLPAIAEENDPMGRQPGSALCPERYKLEDLIQIKKDVGEMVWTALYQGQPVQKGGNIIRADWIKKYTTLPKMDEIAIFADLTYKKNEEADYTVVEAWGRRGPDIYLISQIRDQMGFADQINAMRRMFEAYPEAFHRQVEEKANGSAVIEILKTEFPGIEAFNPKTEKEARIAAVAPIYSSGNVYYPDETIPENSWVKNNIEEITKFPKFKNDDTVDTASMAVSYFGKLAGTMAALEALGRR